MAEDWIKIRTDLYEDQDVLQMSDILGTDDATTVGLLVRFWSWADKQTIDGSGIKITKSRIDALTGRPGFAAALIHVGWLVGEDGNLQLPNFQRHNGASAKARALEAEAKRLRRKEQKTSDKLSDNCPTKKFQKVGPEKRREEYNNPLPPEGEQMGLGFEAAGIPPTQGRARRRNLTQTEKGRIKHPELTPTMIRIGSWFGRQPTTQWTVAEFEALQAVNPPEKEIAGMEIFYTAEESADQKLFRRKSLSVLLNNWNDELDKARDYYRSTVCHA